MYKKLSKLNNALPALLVSIIFFGIVCQLVGVFLVKDKIPYSIGLWIGIVVACAMAYHMAYVLYGSLEQGERGAQVSVTKNNMIRYAMVVIVLGILMATDFANPLAAFLGIMGLKVGAYLQPLTHKLLGRLDKSDIINQAGE